LPLRGKWMLIFIGRNHSRQHRREKADKAGQPRQNRVREVRNPGPGSGIISTLEGYFQT
jgi:hypothetical protein